MTAEIETTRRDQRFSRTESDRETEPMAHFVEALVASAFGIRAGAIREPARGAAPVAFARQVAIYLFHTRLGLSYSATGRLLGRDRTTAAHACRVIEERREDSSLDTVLDCLERSIDLWPRTGAEVRRR